MDEKGEEIIEFYRCEECDKNYKTYQGLYNHNKRHHGSGKYGDMKPLKMTKKEFDERGYKFGKFGRPPAGESVKEKKEKILLEKTEEITAKPERERPDYLTKDYSENESEENQPDSIPDAIKLLNLGGIIEDEDDDSPVSKAALKFQGKLARHFYKLSDSLLEIFGKGYTQNADFEIKRSKLDYDVMEETTVAMMAERNIKIPYSATAVWGISTSIFFGKPISSMVVKRKKKGLKILPKMAFWRRNK
jgi:hypothetical protein